MNQNTNSQCNDFVQGSLFNAHANQPPQPEPQDGTTRKGTRPPRIHPQDGDNIPASDVPDLLRLHYPTIQPVEGYGTFTVAIPAAATPTIWAMGRAQQQDRGTTQRITRRCDYLHLLARLTCCVYLEQDVDKLLTAWGRGLGKGNAGVCFRTGREGYPIGLRATVSSPKDISFPRHNPTFNRLKYVACCTIQERAAAVNVSLWGVVRVDQALGNLHTSPRRGQGGQLHYEDCLDLDRMEDKGMLLPPQWLREAVLWTPGEGL